MRFSECQLKAVDVKKSLRFKEWVAKAIEERCSIVLSYFVCSNPPAKQDTGPVDESPDTSPIDPKCFKMQVRFFFSVNSMKVSGGRVWSRDAMLPLFHSLFFDKDSLQRHITRCIDSSDHFIDVRDTEEFKHFLRYQAFKLLGPFIQEDCLKLVKRSFLLAFMNRLVEPNDPLLEHYQVILSGPLFRAQAVVKSIQRVQDYVQELRRIFHQRADSRSSERDCGNVIVQELQVQLRTTFGFLKQVKMKLFEHFELGRFDKIIDAMIVGLWNCLLRLGSVVKEPIFVSQIRQNILKQTAYQRRSQEPSGTSSEGPLRFLEIDADLTKSFFEQPLSAEPLSPLKLSTLVTVSSLCKGLVKFFSLHTALNFAFLLSDSSPIRLFSLYSLESNECRLLGKGKLSQKFHFHKYYRHSPTLEIDKIAKSLRKKSAKLKKTGPMITSLVASAVFRRCGLQKFVQDLILDLGLGGKTAAVFLQSFSVKRDDLVQRIVLSEPKMLPRHLPVLFASRQHMSKVLKSDNQALSALTSGPGRAGSRSSQMPSGPTLFSFNHFEKLCSDDTIVGFVGFMKRLDWRGLLDDQFTELHVRDLASFALNSVSFSRSSSLQFDKNPLHFLDFYFPDANLQDALEFLSELISRLILKFHPRFLTPSSELSLYQIFPLSPACSDLVNRLNSLLSHANPHQLTAFKHTAHNQSPSQSQFSLNPPDQVVSLFGSVLFARVRELVKGLLSANHCLTFQFASLASEGPSEGCSLQVSALVEGGLGQTLYLNNYFKYFGSASLLLRGFPDPKDRDLFQSVLQLFPLDPQAFISKMVNSHFLEFDIGNLMRWKFFRQESQNRTDLSRRISRGAQGPMESIWTLRQQLWNFRGLVEAVQTQEIGVDLSSHFPEKELTKQSNTLTSNQHTNGKFADNPRKSELESRQQQIESLFPQIEGLEHDARDQAVRLAQTANRRPADPYKPEFEHFGSSKKIFGFE